jgi:hypothetical protein
VCNRLEQQLADLTDQLRAMGARPPLVRVLSLH